MDLDDQLRRYFGTIDIGGLPDAAFAAGTEHILVDFGLAKDRNRRFALWALMHMLGVAPDLDVAFKDPQDREMARDFMDMAAQADEPDEA
jgi:hypothetical protein